MAKEPKSEALRVRVTPTMREQVRQLADEREVDESDVVREAIRSHVADHWKPKRGRRRRG